MQNDSTKHPRQIDGLTLVEKSLSVTWAWMPGAGIDEALSSVRDAVDKWIDRTATVLPLGTEVRRVYTHDDTVAYQARCIAAARGTPMTQAEADALAERIGLKMADQRAERERRRREIDAVLREDAKRSPAFATARRSAALVIGERGGRAAEVATLLRWLHAYEEKRGGRRGPTAEAYAFARVHFGDDVQRAYERGRALP